MIDIKNWFFEKINKIDYGRKIQITKIWNENGDFTNDSTYKYIFRIIKDYKEI